MTAAADLREQLQQTLSNSYTLERELTGGGMSRVFVATETALGRKVVIKVLPREMAEGVSVDRFKREIQLAAQLTHPHIVPVHAAGETNGLPYYTMPLVDGLSLRTRIAKSGPLPMTEAIGYLRDVSKALAYAHDHNVVHRDIKPDNVLITGGSAVVTDFGIAKAIAAARSGPRQETITNIGSAMGTPAYMAPEQAAADPGMNHRADIYAFGVMAYEMLAGAPPFHGRSPQRLLAAQMTELPKPIVEHRPDTPELLAELIMRCLAKDPDARPQTAMDLVKVLETVTSGGNHPAMPQILLGGRPRLGRALALWAAASVAVIIVARAAIIAIGLPDWVFPGAIVVMALGLPAILITYLVHRGAHQAMTVPITPGGTTASQSTLTRLAIRASPHVTWRRTTIGGIVALGVFAVLVSGFMVLRALGLGPVGSLFAKGALQKNERLLVADFHSSGTDTTLGPIVTEAFRTSLGQSQSIMVMPATSVRDVLRRMQRSQTSRVDFALAREIATREGIKAFIDGEILSVGGRYSLSARLAAAQTGETLASVQENADSERDILAAVDRLTRKMRERIGESLRDIREARALEQVTTPSLDALRKYVQGTYALSFEGDFTKGVGLLEEAVAIDTAFAMAYRKLAVEYWNRSFETQGMEYISKAYRHRERLSDAERYLTVSGYYQYGPEQDLGKSISALEALVDMQPNNATALNNSAVAYQIAREFDKAQDAAKRATELPDAPAVAFSQLGTLGVHFEDTAQINRALATLQNRFARNAFSTVTRARILYGAGLRDSARGVAAQLLKPGAADPETRSFAHLVLGSIAETRGQIREARRSYAEGYTLQTQRGSAEAPLQHAARDVWLDAWLRGDSVTARRRIELALSAHPLTSIEPIERPYAVVVGALALLGRVDQAKSVAALFERDRQTLKRTDDEAVRRRMLGDIAVAEGRYEDAIREYRDGDVVNPCVVCMLPRLARAYDLAGKQDSAISVYRRFIETPDAFRVGAARSGVGVDGDFLAPAHKRLAELLEARGDKREALGYYLRFVDLWKNSDPELQPQVEDVRRRIERLKRVEGQ